MKITNVEPIEYDDLLVLWEASVRATHDFLSESDIAYLRPIVRNQALPALTLRAARNDNGKAVGFIGVAERSVEALFVSPDEFGKGIGKALMRHAEEQFDVSKVDINEQNPSALGFYEHLNYRIVGRSPLDAQGRPFPILHLEKS